MEESPYSSLGREEPEFSLRDWAAKERGISRVNTNSRRFSASYIRSFIEDTRSFRSNITISSTASSPGYALRDEIDPATYSFTTALKALQARSAYNSWEALSPDGDLLVTDYVFSENGLVAHKDGKLIGTQSLKSHLGDDKLKVKRILHCIVLASVLGRDLRKSEALF
ncbi:hypothetical protein ABKV19_013970 [Rosa sericea]